MYNTLGELLRKIDERKGPSEIKAFDLINKTAGDLELTMAEKILLYEGSQTGVADCTVAPFVQYEPENQFKIEDLYIRSELLEWMLDSYVSKSVLRAGYLKVIGATILSSSDYVINNRKSENVRDGRYSLNLSSQDIYVDLTFEKCIFNNGINISNSYTENIIFEDCVIGETYGWFSNTEGVSIDAKNATINGDLRISALSKALSVVSDGDTLAKGDINLEFCTIKGDFSIDNQTGEQKSLNRNVYAKNARVKSFNLKSVTVSGQVELQMAVVEQGTDCSGSVIQGDFNCWNLKADNLVFTNFFGEGEVNLSFAEINNLFLDQGVYTGYPLSLEAGGLIAQVVLMRGSKVLFGAAFVKSVISGEADFTGSFFGPSHRDDSAGMALSLQGASFVNGYFGKGFCSIGVLALGDANVSGTLSFQKGRFFNQCDSSASGVNDVRYAIYASNMNVARKITFNNRKIFNAEPLSDFPKENLQYYYVYCLRQIIAANSKIVEEPLNELKRSGKFEKLSILQRVTKFNEACKLYIEKSLENGHTHELFDEVTGTFENSLLTYAPRWLDKVVRSQSLGRNEVRKLNIVRANLKEAKQVLQLFRNNYGAVDNITGDPYLQGIIEPERLRNYAIIYGEAYFEELTLQGQMDCAGGLFYRKVTDHQNMQNALTISHSQISGTLYLNQGFKNLLLPMICKGEVDLQYSRIAQLSISTSLATDRGSTKPGLSEKLRLTTVNRHQHTRWNLIGTRYDYITSDAKASGDNVLMDCDWIYLDKLKENFKQPYEQLSSTLFNVGAENQAREIMIYKIPSAHFFERMFMSIVRFVAFFTFPAQKALLWLLAMGLAGWFIFNKAASQNHIIAINDHALVHVSKATLLKIKSVPALPKTMQTPTAGKPAAALALADENPGSRSPALREPAIASESMILFSPFWFSLERLVPLVDLEQKEFFKVSTNGGLYHAYYRFHSIWGAICVGVFLLGISKIRRNS